MTQTVDNNFFLSFFLLTETVVRTWRLVVHLGGVKFLNPTYDKTKQYNLRNTTHFSHSVVIRKTEEALVVFAPCTVRPLKFIYII